MKILLINIRYGYVGGPERYLFNLKQLLENKGHEIIPFSIKYPLNENTPYDKYFVSPLSDDQSVYFKNQKWNARSVKKTLERNFYSGEVEQNLSNLIDDTRPDFAIVMLYLRKLSPAVLVALHEKKIPFYVRLSDFGMICAGHNFFRGNEICELCSTGDLLNSVKYKCVQNSYGASLVNYLATRYHQAKGYFNLIPHFVAPSKFLISKMVDAGWSNEKFSHLPTFANLETGRPKAVRKNQLMYSGRLEYIKGVHTLLEAMKILREKYNTTIALKLAGNGNDDYVNRLQSFCDQNKIEGVEFLGNLKKEELFKVYEESLVSVIPSLCYDNLPNSALESLSVGTPVIAPDHGSFPELIRHNENGMLFKHDDAEDLAAKIQLVISNEILQEQMREKAVESIKTTYSAEQHYSTLMSIIAKIRNQQHINAS